MSEEQKTQQQLNEDFITAVILGDIEAATETIVAGASIHALTSAGNNALYVAASRRQEEMFMWLLDISQADKKIDINHVNHLGSSVLLELVKEGDMEFFIEHLLKAGANPDTETLTGMNPLVFACSSKRYVEAETLLRHGANVNYLIKDTGNTPFMMAASMGDIEMCQLLSKYNADIHVLDALGKNALLNAIYTSKQYMKKYEKEDHKNLCIYLLESGIDLNYQAPSTMTAISAATMVRDKSMTRRLLEKDIDVTRPYLGGMSGMTTVLHSWAMMGNTTFVTKLVEKGAQLGIEDEQGNTPEAYAFSRPNFKLQKAMIMDMPGANVNSILHMKTKKQQDKEQHIPILSLAIALNGDQGAEMIDAMIQRGANVVYDKKYEAYDPVGTAINVNAPQACALLLKTGQIDVNKPIPTQMGYSTYVLYQWAMDANNNLVAELQKAHKKLVENMGVNSDEKEEQELANEVMQVLKIEETMRNDFMCKQEVLDVLIAGDAKLNIVNEQGQNEAFFANSERTVHMLIEKGTDFFHKDNEGRNPLLAALINNKTTALPVLKALYEDKKDPTIENMYYQLAFEPANNSFAVDNICNGILNYLQNKDLAKAYAGKTKEEDIPQGGYPIANINYQDEDGNGALLVACANSNAQLAYLYMLGGADVNLANNNGETPIMHALGAGNEYLALALLDKGANWQATTLDGKNVIDFAQEAGAQAFIKKIEELTVNSSNNEASKMKP
jgi:uncharacterized protein